MYSPPLRDPYGYKVYRPKFTLQPQITTPEPLKDPVLHTNPIAHTRKTPSKPIIRERV